MGIYNSSFIVRYIIHSYDKCCGIAAVPYEGEQGIRSKEQGFILVTCYQLPVVSK